MSCDYEENKTKSFLDISIEPHSKPSVIFYWSKDPRKLQLVIANQRLMGAHAEKVDLWGKLGK